jgi:hypothetical protein
MGCRYGGTQPPPRCRGSTPGECRRPAQDLFCRSVMVRPLAGKGKGRAPPPTCRTCSPIGSSPPAPRQGTRMCSASSTRGRDWRTRPRHLRLLGSSRSRPFHRRRAAPRSKPFRRRHRRTRRLHRALERSRAERRHPPLHRRPRRHRELRRGSTPRSQAPANRHIDSNKRPHPLRLVSSGLVLFDDVRPIWARSPRRPSSPSSVPNGVSSPKP